MKKRILIISIIMFVIAAVLTLSLWEPVTDYMQKKRIMDAANALDEAFYNYDKTIAFSKKYSEIKELISTTNLSSYESNQINELFDKVIQLKGDDKSDEAMTTLVIIEQKLKQTVIPTLEPTMTPTEIPTYVPVLETEPTLDLIQVVNDEIFEYSRKVMKDYPMEGVCIVVYTDIDDEEKLINFARNIEFDGNGFKYVHFYDSKDKAPDIENINISDDDVFYLYEFSDGRFLIYLKQPYSNREIIFDRDFKNPRIVK